MCIVAPSILAANFLELGNEIEKINISEADWIHIDIMDGVFVPNISFGFPILDAVRKKTTKVLDVHLMITAPEKYIETCKQFGADAISVHFEKNLQVVSILKQIKTLGMQAGIVLNPDTAIDVLTDDILDSVDYILLMSVFPGFGGQKFIPETVEKVAVLKSILKQKNKTIQIEVDGGVDTANAASLIQAGADILVAGSAVFKTANYAETIHKIKYASL